MKRNFRFIVILIAAIITAGGIWGITAYLTRHRHTPKWVTAAEAGCVETGAEQYLCTECGEIFETRVIGAHGHIAGEWNIHTAPTCVDAGQKTLLCAVCGAVIGTEVIDAAGHTAGEWETATAASCTGGGSRVLLCTRCGDVLKTETTEPTGHSFPDEWTRTKEPSCTETGIRAKTCMLCGETVTEPLPMTAHRFGAWSKNDGGGLSRACTVCGYREVIEDGITPEQEKFDSLVGSVAASYKNVSVTYMEPVTGAAYFAGSTDVYHTQSTIKAAYCAYLVYIGANMSDTVRLETPVKASASGVLTEENVGKSYTVESLIGYVLMDSDNQAYFMLVEKFGRDGYNTFLQNEIGIENPTLYGSSLFSYATSAEMAKVMCYICNHREACAYLITCMSSLRGMIDLGTDRPVAQKYGYNVGDYHDIAIVFDDIPYVLSVFTNESADTDVFEKISEAVFEFHKAVHG